MSSCKSTSLSLVWEEGSSTGPFVEGREERLLARLSPLDCEREECGEGCGGGGVWRGEGCGGERDVEGRGVWREEGCGKGEGGGERKRGSGEGERGGGDGRKEVRGER